MERGKVTIVGWSFTEYDVLSWQTTFPDGAVSMSCFSSGPPGARRADVCFLSDDDCYGYIGHDDDAQIGWSVNEGSDYFVNYLAQPRQWSHIAASLFVPAFRTEARMILLLAQRLLKGRCNVRDIGQLIIQALADAYYDKVKDVDRESE